MGLQLLTVFVLKILSQKLTLKEIQMQIFLKLNDNIDLNLISTNKYQDNYTNLSKFDLDR